jgi:hypothetical protein
MMGQSCKKNALEKASARVVDGKLILSLPAANTPVVWQMDLGHAKASALEVRHNEEAAIFTLMLKTAKGETMEIASFSERERSIEGLMAASRALESGYGQIKQGIANDSAASAALDVSAPKKGRGWFVALALVALFVVFLVWGSLTPVSVMTTSQSGENPSLSTNGVPLSAEDYLKNQ